MTVTHELLEAIGVPELCDMVVPLKLVDERNLVVGGKSVGIDLVLELCWQGREREDLLFGDWFGGCGRNSDLGFLHCMVRSMVLVGTDGNSPCSEERSLCQWRPVERRRPQCRLSQSRLGNMTSPCVYALARLDEPWSAGLRRCWPSCLLVWRFGASIGGVQA